MIEPLEPYFSDKFSTPSASYLAARAVRQDLEAARARVAATIGVRPAEIVFTAGATEACNLAIQGVQRQFPEAEIIASAIEHEAVLAPVKLGRYGLAPVNDKGVVDLTKLEKLINDKTVLVSVMMVNNELGVVQPIKEIAQLLNKLRIERKAKGNKLPLYFHTDAAQAGNYLDLHIARLGVDLMSINGGKIYGPKQSGVLAIKAGTCLTPLIVGGGQESGLRSGTENLAYAVGLAEALALAQSKHKAEAERITRLRQNFETGLNKLIPAAQVNGSPKRRAPHITSVTIDGIDNERVMMELDERGVMCAVGSACSASSDEPSHVLTATDLSRRQAQSTLRFSFGHHTLDTDIRRVVQALSEILL